MKDNKPIVPKREVFKMFIGGIPPFLLFEMEYHSLFAVVEHHKGDRIFKKPNPAAQAVLISIVAHFEAFCSHQFAALVNIHPKLLNSFAEKRGQLSIRLSDLATLLGKLDESMGFIVAEQYDFGSAEKINTIFKDLITVSPFSKNEAKKYNEILKKRHLLVHHAGIYTLQFLKEVGIPEDVRERAFKDSVTISTEDCHKMSGFLFDLALKITRTTTSALKKIAEGEGQKKDYFDDAVEQLATGLYDTLEVDS